MDAVLSDLENMPTARLVKLAQEFLRRQQPDVFRPALENGADLRTQASDLSQQIDQASNPIDESFRLAQEGFSEIALKLRPRAGSRRKTALTPVMDG